MSCYRMAPQAPPLPSERREVESNDQSLNGHASPSLADERPVNGADFRKLFLSEFGLDYIADDFERNNTQCRIVTHPKSTNTCFEKAALLGRWSPLNVIKALYFEWPDPSALFAVVIPETGCFVDRQQIAIALRLPSAAGFRKTSDLPKGMKFGTCSPFIQECDSVANGGRVRKILFDRETLALKRNEGSIDDFSYGTDHRFSIQMNYSACYDMLQRKFGNLVAEESLLTLSFKEVFVRNRGRVRISYEFNSLSYKIASFIDSIHGYGDVSIVNDYVDELDLPDTLSLPKQRDA